MIISISSSGIQNAVMVFLNSQLLSRVRKLFGKLLLIFFTCFPIKIPTRVIWWRVVFWKDASEQRNVGLNSNYWGNILYIYQLRVSLRQTFLLCKSLSTTMTLVTVSLRRAQWHDGPTQGEMLRESARAAVLGRADARQVYLCVIITDC